MKKACLNCKREFETPRQEKKFCSAACRATLWLKKKCLFQSKITDIPQKLPVRKVESGILFEAIKKEKRCEDFWIFCHSMFWHTQDFHESEKNGFKQLIAEYFGTGSAIDDKFIELVERACLAKRHVEEKDSRYIPQPEEWLSIQHPNGLSHTQQWYIALQKQRLHSPDFNKGLVLFGEAILSYADKRNILDIAYYRRAFITLTHYDLLQWYMNAIMHYQFIDFQI